MLVLINKIIYNLTNCQFRPVMGCNGTPAAKLVRPLLLVLVAIVFNFVGASISEGCGSMIYDLVSVVLNCNSSLLISYAAGTLPLT